MREDAPTLASRSTALAWGGLHFWCACTECRKPLGGLYTHESLDRLTKKIGAIHRGVSDLKRAFVKIIINGDGGSHGITSEECINTDVNLHQIGCSNKVL
jgi:hypothetical protein